MPFDVKTLIVTGAGASAELGFPVGNKLKANIRSLSNIDWNGLELTGNKVFCRILEDTARVNYGGRLDSILAACKHVHENVILSGSIDQFLSSHQDDPVLVKCAKLAIAFEISKAETESHLNTNASSRDHTDFVYLKDSYFPRLWARLQSGLPIKEWRSYFENLRVITFNYDRTLEQFLRLALTRFCRANESEVLTFLGQLPILHVYGNLGTLSTGSDHCPYAPNHHQIIDSADRILTFSETVRDNVRNEIEDYFMWANRIVFLGFSFANVNMDLFPTIDGAAKEVFGTSMAMSAPNTDHARNRVNRLVDNVNRRAVLSPTNCAQLFDDFELRLC
jgi:hypothetical protein